MKGDIRCVDGRSMRHDPQYDDPELETDVGECPECGGQGCSDGTPNEPPEQSLATLQRENKGLREALERAAATFRRYEKMHTDKQTLEGDIKSRANAVEAEQCEATLSKPAPAVDAGEKEARAQCLAEGIDPDAEDYKGRKQWTEYVAPDTASAVVAAAVEAWGDMTDYLCMQNPSFERLCKAIDAHRTAVRNHIERKDR